MYENTNQRTVVEIARGSMKSHRLRNIMAVMAIMLTTLLITVVCTVGVSFYETVDRGSDMAPSPMADGGIRGNISLYERLAGMDEVEWAGYVRPCNLGSLHNKEMVGITSKLFAANDSYLKNNKITLEEGRFPENGQELAIADTMASRLELKEAVGKTITLHPVILEDGKQKEIEAEMVITGVFASPIESLKNVYEEMYTGEDFLNGAAKDMAEEDATLYVKLAQGTGQSYEALCALDEKIGGHGVIFRTHNTMSLGGVLLVVCFLLLIMFCGYLIIYNIFYISVVNDIRFLGMMKTIGTTGRQVKKILSWQVRRLSGAGIVLGILAGYLVSLVAAPVVMAQTTYADFYELPKNPLGFVAAALFAALTVAVSCRKSYRMASRISPVEAARYTGGGRNRKKLWSVLSFAISGVIFLVVYTATIGYDVEDMVERYNTADVRVFQNAMEQGSEEAYKPVSPDFPEKLKTLSYIENVSCFYKARLDSPGENAGISEATVPMKVEGKWKTEWEERIIQYQAIMEEMGRKESLEEIRRFLEDEDGNARMRVIGMPAGELEREKKNIKIVEGTFDEEKFASGDYILYNQMGVPGQAKDENHIHAGDVLPVTLYEPQRREFVTVEKEVMAVTAKANMFAVSIINDGDIILQDAAFTELFPEYKDWISKMQIDGKEELTGEQYREIKSMVQETYNSQLSLRSRYETREEQQKTKNSMTIIGLFLAGVFGIIGIANVVNTLVTSVMARKLEYAAMQSVGMTKKQMCASLIRDGFKLAGITTVFSILAGAILGPTLFEKVPLLTGFSLPAFAFAAGILILVLAVLTVSVALLLTAFLNRKPVVERLREAE